MSAEMKIEYFTPEFDKFRQDVLNAGLKGIIVSKLMPFAPAITSDFRKLSCPESDLERADIVINITSNVGPATIYGRSFEGTKFIKTMKYAILK